jgi:hypothetical protein
MQSCSAGDDHMTNAQQVLQFAPSVVRTDAQRQSLLQPALQIPLSESLIQPFAQKPPLSALSHPKQARLTQAAELLRSTGIKEVVRPRLTTANLKKFIKACRISNGYTFHGTL